LHFAAFDRCQQVAGEDRTRVHRVHTRARHAHIRACARISSGKDVGMGQAAVVGIHKDVAARVKLEAAVHQPTQRPRAGRGNHFVCR
jgi:hypothetical protein